MENGYFDGVSLEIEQSQAIMKVLDAGNKNPPKLKDAQYFFNLLKCS